MDLASRGLVPAVLALPDGDPAFARRVERAELARAVVLAGDDPAEDLGCGLELDELDAPDADRIGERAVVPLRERERVTHDPLRA
jgi:hypothetical protein